MRGGEGYQTYVLLDIHCYFTGLNLFAKNSMIFIFSRFSAVCLSAEFGTFQIKSVRINPRKIKSSKVNG